MNSHSVLEGKLLSGHAFRRGEVLVVGRRIVRESANEGDNYGKGQTHGQGFSGEGGGDRPRGRRSASRCG